VTTHYSLLGILPTAAPEDVKRAFRREVARYHPDKVQHLGLEFQEIATARAAALTEAYRTLMDTELRQRYDAQLPTAGGSPEAPALDASRPQPHATPHHGGATAPQAGGGNLGPAVHDTITLDLVRRAVLAKIQEAARALGGQPTPATAFDVAYAFKGRKGLFRSSEPTTRVAVKVFPRVDAEAVQTAWSAAIRVQADGQNLCVFVLGSGLAPSGELAGVVSDLRRRTRGGTPLVVPVDLRTWQPLLPPETPPAARALLERLRRGE
jgi:hypothetical protein